MHHASVATADALRPLPLLLLLLLLLMLLESSSH
jgi:hypothetical protein